MTEQTKPQEEIITIPKREYEQLRANLIDYLKDSISELDEHSARSLPDFIMDELPLYLWARERLTQLNGWEGPWKDKRAYYDNKIANATQGQVERGYITKTPLPDDFYKLKGVS